MKRYDAMSVKMIVTDLDNTLLRRDKTASDYTVNIFKQLREHSILTAFATARYFRTVEEWIIPRIGIHPEIVISLNGAHAYQGAMPLYKATISSETGNTIVGVLRKNGGKIMVGTSRIRYSERPIEDTHASFSVKYNFNEPIYEEFHYIDVCGVDSNTLDRIAIEFPELRYQRYTDSALITFQHVNAGKGIALSSIMERLNISSDEVIGFGDDHNDIEMLCECGVGVAVANAIDECKAVADYICGDCDIDGVAHWIEENVL